MAMNHFTSDRLLSSKIVPTLHEKLRLHFLQRNFPSFRAVQWCSPQYGQTTSCASPMPQRVTIIVCLHTSSLLKYIVIEMRLSKLEKSIMAVPFLCFISPCYKSNVKVQLFPVKHETFWLTKARQLLKIARLEEKRKMQPY